MNNKLTLWLWTVSWYIYASVWCVIVPAIGILCAYYEWELADGHQYFGYAIQTQLFRLDVIIADTAAIQMAIAGVCCICC